MINSVMRRLLVAAGAAFLSLSSVTGQIIERSFLIDFGDNGGATADQTWNTLSNAMGITNTAILPLLRDTTATQSTFSLQMVSRFGGQNTNGTTSSSLYPAFATSDSLYGNTEDFQGLSNLTPIFKLTNLDLSKAYNFTFYASRTGVSDNRETGYTVTGGISGFTALNAANNVNNFAQVSGITPDSNGEITISLAPTANNNQAMHFVYLGVLRMDVVPVPEPSAALAIVSGIGLLGLIRRRRG